MTRHILEYNEHGDVMHVDFHRGKDTFPTVVILPILGSKNGKAPDAKVISWVFRLFGWSTCIAYHPEELFKNTKDEKDFGEKVRRIRDAHMHLFYIWLEKNAPDPEKIVLWGVSFGAIITCGIANLIPGYKAAVAVMGGAPIADVVRFSKERRVKKFWEHLLNLRSGPPKQRIGLTGASLAYSNLSEEVGSIDPYYTSENRKVPLLMVQTKFDKSVPTDSQELLYRRMKHTSDAPCRAIMLLTGHYSIIFLIWLARGAAHSWYWSQLRRKQ